MKTSNFRLSLVTIFCLVAILTIIIQMFHIQNSAEAQDFLLFDSQYQSAYVTVYPARGSIYDRWGNLLAGNEQVYEVGVDYNTVVNPETIAEAANKVLGVDLATARSIANIPYDDQHRYAVLADFVTADKITQLENLVKKYDEAPPPKDKHQLPTTLDGMVWKPHLKRTYPEGSLASNILGFYTFMDREGGSPNYGVEEMYNDTLTGIPQKRLVTNNPHLIGDLNPVPPGDTLVLTIDRAIQASIEETLDRAIQTSGADAGTILVLDPKTGEILGMANSPRFDINEYWKYPNLHSGQLFNRAVSNTYEPGSVFKILTMAAAIDAGLVTPDTTTDVPGVYEMGGGYIYNWDGGGWGTQTMRGCMQHSLNVCLAKVAEILGPTRFYAYLEKFGIGQNTQVDIAGESHQPLRLPGDANWYPIDLGTNSFGQGLAVTPLQLAMAVAAVPNDGKIMAVHVVRSMIINGRQYDTPLKVVGTPIKPEVAREMSEMLAITLEKEASDALVEGYRVAGKTGTAEIPTPYGYTLSETNASFVGWGPVDDPRFLVYIWLEKPTSSRWGSVVAAPVFSEVVKNLVVLMNIPPDDVRWQLAGN
jgi:cell division protein FtsI/penicillin-binding protein 2